MTYHSAAIKETCDHRTTFRQVDGTTKYFLGQSSMGLTLPPEDPRARVR